MPPSQARTEIEGEAEKIPNGTNYNKSDATATMISSSSRVLTGTLRVASRVPRRPPFQCPRRTFHSSSRRSSQGYFRFLDDVPEDTVFWGIIGLNGTGNPKLRAFGF